MSDLSGSKITINYSSVRSVVEFKHNILDWDNDLFPKNTLTWGIRIPILVVNKYKKWWYILKRQPIL